MAMIGTNKELKIKGAGGDKIVKISLDHEAENSILSSNKKEKSNGFIEDDKKLIENMFESSQIEPIEPFDP